MFGLESLMPLPGFFLALLNGPPEEEGPCPLITVLHILFNAHFNIIEYTVLSYHKNKATTTSHSN